jgi:hypothetical protein
MCGLGTRRNILFLSFPFLAMKTYFHFPSAETRFLCEVATTKRIGNGTEPMHKNRRPLPQHGLHTFCPRLLSRNSWYFLRCPTDFAGSGQIWTKRQLLLVLDFLKKLVLGPRHFFLSEVWCQFCVVPSGVPRNARSCKKSFRRGLIWA